MKTTAIADGSVAQVQPPGQMLGHYLLVAFPFVAFSISVVTFRYTSLPGIFTGWVLIITLVSILTGAVMGWLNSFPHWSYPYTMILVYMVVLLLARSDSEMSLAENVFFKSIILSPLILIFFLVWLFARCKQPLRSWYLNIQNQLTLLSFLVYSFLPLAINTIFTEMRSIYGAPFLAASTIFATTGACLYIYLQVEKLRLWALSVSFTLAWVSITFASATYWHGRAAARTTGIINGYRLALDYAAYWALMLILMLLPPLLIWSRRQWNHNHTFPSSESCV